jgi:DNA-binding transcriptional ArsR family regulator
MAENSESKCSVDEQTAELIASLFESLSDPTRVRIISSLVDGEVNVGDLVQIIGLSKSAISHQLRGLRDKRVEAEEVETLYFGTVWHEALAVWFEGLMIEKETANVHASNEPACEVGCVTGAEN